TSGIMVVARNQVAAATLCEAWRERDSVQKIYLAHVKRWPPYHQQGISEGTIEIPLAASRTERIKWEVRPVADGGKACKTNWKVYEDFDKSSSTDKEGAAQISPTSKRGLTLELHPITGRTHQLRLHCAAVGSGIVGDSLYGDSPIEWFGDRDADTDTIHKQVAHTTSTVSADAFKTLRLHAHKLVFMHPTKGEKLAFETPKPW
ncbi:hypothetical protein ACHAXR_002494, partial [Thalassiosira sp. AJA248-18]